MNPSLHPNILIYFILLFFLICFRLTSCYTVVNINVKLKTELDQQLNQWLLLLKVQIVQLIIIL